LLSLGDAGVPDAASPVRRLDTECGGIAFCFYQFANGDDLLAVLEKAREEDLFGFLNHVFAEASDRVAFLVTMFDMPARVYKLYGDDLFIALTRQLMAMPDLPRAKIRAERVTGYDTIVAAVPARAFFREHDVMAACSGAGLSLGQVNGVHTHLGRENDRQKIAAMTFATPPETGEWLLVGQRGLVVVEAEVATFADMAACHAAFRDNADGLALLIETDEDAAPLLNRLSRQQPARASVDEPLLAFHFTLETAISLAGGLFASGWFVDPEQRLDAVFAVDHCLEDAEISAQWKTFAGRADLGGRTVAATRFVAYLPRDGEAGLIDRVAVRLALSNGESMMVDAVPVPSDLASQRQRIVDTIVESDFDAEQFAEVYQPALDPLNRQLGDRQGIRRVCDFAPASSRTVSLIIPLYREIGFIRSQLMAFATDPFVRAQCEILYVLDDPVLEPDVMSLLEGQAILHALDVRLVVLERNGGFSLANNMGASIAAGEVLVLMNSDVVPARAGWLEAGIERLEQLPGGSVIGAKLLYADEGLQHAGMYFDRTSPHGWWQNMHCWKGYGRWFEPANQERAVAAVTGACMILHKADFDAVGGFSTDYIIGDFEDSDLCLKLGEIGGTCLYMPSLELFHFERQSMPGQDDRSGLGASLYNRALHTQRWNTQISAAAEPAPYTQPA
jgi:GT2 family glycosyltransferase